MDLETEAYSGNSQKAVQRYTTAWKVISLFVLLATTIKMPQYDENISRRPQWSAAVLLFLLDNSKHQTAKLGQGTCDTFLDHFQAIP